MAMSFGALRCLSVPLTSHYFQLSSHDYPNLHHPNLWCWFWLASLPRCRDIGPPVMPVPVQSGVSQSRGTAITGPCLQATPLTQYGLYRAMSLRWGRFRRGGSLCSGSRRSTRSFRDAWSGSLWMPGRFASRLIPPLSSLCPALLVW